MSESAVIARTSLHQTLVSLLRDMITNGELKPGQKIPEHALCERFGVSRTPLREALKVLAAEGPVVLSPNRGASVARITRQEIEELFPIMGALEALAGELACERISDAEIARIRTLHEAMVGHYRRGEFAPYAKLNREIHEAIFAAAGNAALTGLYENLLFRTHSVRFVARKTAARWREAVEDHEAMQAALEARDGPRLARLMRDHIRHKAEMVTEFVETLDAAE